MKNNNPNAGFLLRLLAYLFDFFLFLLPHLLFLSFLISSYDLNELAYRLTLYFALVFLPLCLLGFFYNPVLTTYFGGSIGKLLTGLQVTDENGKFLPLRLSLFRYWMGYAFSSLIFGLGFWAIIKNPEKRAWHDKAVGSKVVVIRKTWFVSLILLVLLLIFEANLLVSIVSKIKISPLSNEVQNLVTQYNNESKMKESSSSGKIQATITPTPYKFQVPGRPVYSSPYIQTQ